MKNQKAILARLTELAEFFPMGKIELSFNEIFEYHLKVTTLSGEPLALQYFLLNELKAIMSDVATSARTPKSKN